MRDYWQFFQREAPLLTYDVLLTLLSSVGQTFFVSLYVPDFLQEYALDEGSFGLLYSGPTDCFARRVTCAVRTTPSEAVLERKSSTTPLHDRYGRIGPGPTRTGVRLLASGVTPIR